MNMKKLRRIKNDSSTLNKTKSVLFRFNPIYWLRRLNDKFIAFEQEGYKGMFELASDLSNKDNKMYCKHCGHFLNVLKMPILASNVKVGETYEIKCSSCRKMNTITKGTEKYEE